MASAATKERAYELIARLPPEKVAVAVEALEKLAEPVSRRLADIPLEDEEISAAEEDAVARAKADGSAPTSMADFLVELGLTQADVDGVGQESQSQRR